MVAAVRIVLRDGSVRVVREYDDLTEATSAAFEVADSYGLRAGDGVEIPERVQIVVADRVELSIRVIRGGLRPRADGSV